MKSVCETKVIWRVYRMSPVLCSPASFADKHELRLVSE